MKFGKILAKVISYIEFITKINSLINVLPNINTINFEKQRFIQHYVFPEVELLDDNDQLNIDNISFLKKT